MKFIFLSLIFSSFVFGQAKGKATMVIYPGCETYVKKGNQQLFNCLNNSMKADLKEELEHVLKVNNLSAKTTSMNAKVKFKINEVGEIEDIVVDGTVAEQFLLHQAFVSFSANMANQSKKIIPAVNDEGKTVGLRFSMPFVIQNFNR